MRSIVTLITMLSLICIANMVLGAFVGDPGDATMPWATQLDTTARALADFSGTAVRIVLVLALMIGGVMYAMGIGLGRRETEDASLPYKPARPAEPAVVLSGEVVAVRQRISTSIIKLRAMPADSVPTETRIDLNAIRNDHLPDLERAHRTARSVYPDNGPESRALDSDLTASLKLIAARLDEMIEECGREARNDFATQRRFIELRHPSSANNPLALPQVTMVDARA